MNIDDKLNKIILLLSENAERIQKLEDKLNDICKTVQKTEEKTNEMHYNYIPYVDGLKSMSDSLRFLSFMKTPTYSLE